MQETNLLEEIKIERKEFKDYISKGLKLWVKKENNFKIYIFSIKFDSENEFMNEWEDLISKIAYHYQADLENPMLEIEKYNMYVFFFVHDPIRNNLKFTIEHDKYSTRKIVVDNISENIDDIQIKQKISEKLFSLKLPFKQEKRIENLLEIYRNFFPELYKMMISNELDMKIDDNKIESLFKEYLNNLGDFD